MNETLLRIRNVATVELVPDRTARRVIAVAAFALATALAAYVRVPIPFTPVPITLQTLFVILSGVMLGPRLGAAAQLSYLAMGIAGLPVFAAGIGAAALFGPTGGYLLAFPAAAFLAGIVTGPMGTRSASVALRLLAGLTAASLLILVSGAAWLGVFTGNMAGAFALGFVPFLVGDALKVAFAALVAWRGRDRTLGLL
jgi:biotin transport system substrate-specific component